MERQTRKRLNLISHWCAPRVLAVCSRTLWNGWVTSERMEQIFRRTGQYYEGCLFKCGWKEDKLEHYICCSIYWQFVTAGRPTGLGVAACHRSREGALLLSPALVDSDVVRLAVGLYALYRTLNHLRFRQPQVDNICIVKLLLLFAKRGADGSKAAGLLRFGS